MIKELTTSDHPHIDHVDDGKLEKVNIFTGRNRTGKTLILKNISETVEKFVFFDEIRTIGRCPDENETIIPFAAGSTVLIDEFENGIHVDAMKEKIIGALSLFQNYAIEQLFIVTHSFDFYKSLPEALDFYNMRDDAKLFTLMHLKQTGLTAFGYTMDVLEGWLEIGIDPRRPIR